MLTRAFEGSQERHCRGEQEIVTFLMYARLRGSMLWRLLQELIPLAEEKGVELSKDCPLRIERDIYLLEVCRNAERKRRRRKVVSFRVPIPMTGRQ